MGDILYRQRLNLLVLFAGGLLWAAATVMYQRRANGACIRCGRRPGAPDAAPERPLTWGRRAVLVAALAPLPYEITRIAWFFGYPLGVTRAFLKSMQDTHGLLTAGLGFAAASALGGVLTHGLVASWGERYPRWIWWKAGRRVPPGLAVVPGGLVAVLLIPAGLMFVRTPFPDGMWGTNAPSTLWVVWGAALGVAVGAYHLRRRPPCRRCASSRKPERITAEASEPVSWERVSYGLRTRRLRQASTSAAVPRLPWCRTDVVAVMACTIGRARARRHLSALMPAVRVPT